MLKGLTAPVIRAFPVLSLLLYLGCALPAVAQQAPSQEEINKQLLQRINELEAQVKQLKDTPPQAAPAPAPPPPPAVEAPRQNEVAERLKFRVFGDVG